MTGKPQADLKRKYDDYRISIIQFISIRSHIVHLSTADALPLIKEFRDACGNDRLTVETCHHYLVLSAECIPKQRVDFKCCPPIRDADNQNALWEAVRSGDINMVVSDHSPNLAENKLLVEGQKDFGDFLKSWGGIPGIQFGKTNLKTINLLTRKMASV